MQQPFTIHCVHLAHLLIGISIQYPSTAAAAAGAEHDTAAAIFNFADRAGSLYLYLTMDTAFLEQRR